jgi:hydroxylaminobenzene mutase
LIWHKIELSDRWLKITFWLSVYGTFVNWFGILIAAIFDAGAMLGIVAHGKEGPPVAEGFVTFSLISLSIAMLIISVTVLIGLKRGMDVKTG